MTVPQCWITIDRIRQDRTFEYDDRSPCGGENRKYVVANMTVGLRAKFFSQPRRTENREKRTSNLYAITSYGSEEQWQQTLNEILCKAILGSLSLLQPQFACPSSFCARQQQGPEK